ncbi:hypothetical protein C0Q70_15069 [Pomacea canaliculata]|uniref:BACK domain-containing protein n=1 Tax=Pomacea canaliculata TaxID=400727 RepID=A0A2T7NTU7_POMCA|nr:hypothetical protein C0Q70_15069 [Pomacea canaliculata]
MSKNRSEIFQSSRPSRRENTQELSCSIHAPRRHDTTEESEEEVPVRDTGLGKQANRSESAGGAPSLCRESNASLASQGDTQKKTNSFANRVSTIHVEASCSTQWCSASPSLCITPNNVDSLLISAIFYNQEDVVSLCKAQLYECTLENALYYKYVAEKHHLIEVLPFLRDFIRSNFTSIIKTHSFLTMGVEQLQSLLSDDCLKVNRELDVFFAAHSWLNHQDERKKYAGDVMACVRFEHISPKDLMLHVEPSCKFFMELEGLEALPLSSRYHALQSSQCEITATDVHKLPPVRRYVPATFKRPPTPQVKVRQRISSVEQNKGQACRRQVDFNFRSDGPFPEFSSSQIIYHCHGSRNDNQQQNQNHPMVQPPCITEPSAPRVYRHSTETRAHVRSFSEPATRGSTTDAPTKEEWKSSGSMNLPQASNESPNTSQRHHTARQTAIYHHQHQQGKNTPPERFDRYVDPKHAANLSSQSQQQAEEFNSFSDHGNMAKTGGGSSPRGWSGLHTKRDDDGHYGSKPRPDLKRRPQQMVRDDRGYTQQSLGPCTVLLAIGGLNPYKVDTNVPTRLVEKYDPRNNNWHLLTKLPDPRHHHACAVLEGCLYLIGGSVVDSRDLYNMSNPTNSCYRYDLSGNYWTAIAPMNSSRMYHALAVLKGVLYVIGGQTYDDKFLSTVEYYNPDSGTWGHVASLIDPTIGVAAIGFKNYVYVIGGFLEMDDESIVLGSVECFDPQRNRQVDIPPPSAFASVPLQRGGGGGPVVFARGVHPRVRGGCCAVPGVGVALQRLGRRLGNIPENAEAAPRLRLHHRGEQDLHPWRRVFAIQDGAAGHRVPGRSTQLLVARSRASVPAHHRPQLCDHAGHPHMSRNQGR